MGIGRDADGVDVSEPRQPAGQGGFTLPELLLAMLIGLLVMGLPITLALSSFTAENASASRSATSARAQVGMDRLVRDLRQAVAVDVTSQSAPATAVLSVPTQRSSNLAAIPAPTTVTWTCTPGGSCVRSSSTGVVDAAITGVVSASFVPTTFPGRTEVGRVDVEVAVGLLSERKRRLETVEGTRSVLFRNGVDLRNLG